MQKPFSGIFNQHSDQLSVTLFTVSDFFIFDYLDRDFTSGFQSEHFSDADF